MSSNSSDESNSQQGRSPPHCRLCENHGKIVTLDRNIPHKCKKKKEKHLRKCKPCRTVRDQQKAQADGKKFGRKFDSNNPKFIQELARTPGRKCPKCKYHFEIRPTHPVNRDKDIVKDRCPYIKCSCKSCKLVEDMRKSSKDMNKRKRNLARTGQNEESSHYSMDEIEDESDQEKDLPVDITKIVSEDADDKPPAIVNSESKNNADILTDEKHSKSTVDIEEQVGMSRHEVCHNDKEEVNFPHQDLYEGPEHAIQQKGFCFSREKLEELEWIYSMIGQKQ